MFPKIGGTPPKSSILIGFSIIDHPFWGKHPPIIGSTPTHTSFHSKNSSIPRMDIPKDVKAATVGDMAKHEHQNVDHILYIGDGDTTQLHEDFFIRHCFGISTCLRDVIGFLSVALTRKGFRSWM